MHLLLENQGGIVTRAQLLAGVWDGGHAVGSNVVEVLIRGLRKKLADSAGLIDTVRGVGYRWQG